MRRTVEHVSLIEVVEIKPTPVWARRLRYLLRDKVGIASIATFAALVIMTILAPMIAPYDPRGLEIKHPLEPPSSKHLMGTDELGRDIFSRVLYGGRMSIGAALIVVMMVSFIGTVLGTVAGHLGGLADEVIMRVADIFLAFPSVILAMAFASALGPSAINAAIALGLVWWPPYARLVRGQVLATRDALYVDAARSFGATDFVLITRHILPNCMDPVFVRMTMTAGYAILAFAGLSFIGLGAQPPASEWGLLISNARNYLYSAGWYPTLVGLVIFVAVMAATLAADAIQDAFAPTLMGAE